MNIWVSLTPPIRVLIDTGNGDFMDEYEFKKYYVEWYNQYGRGYSNVLQWTTIHPEYKHYTIDENPFLFIQRELPELFL